MIAHAERIDLGALSVADGGDPLGRGGVAMKGRLAGAMVLSATLAACGAAPEVRQAGGSGQVVVTGADLPYTQSDGAAARQAADAVCGPRGVRTSIYDSFDAGRAAWVYPEGCA